MTRTLVVILALMGVVATPLVWAATISVTGSWSETIDVSDLQGGAGSNLTSTYTSASNAVTIDVGVSGNTRWYVDVYKVDSTWHSNLHLHVCRTSDGSGEPGSSISGGSSFQEVTGTAQSFFAGRRSRTGITVQLQLTGVSVSVPAHTYSTTVYYTAVEN